MNGWIDVRDETGVILFRYHPILEVVEVLVHRYDRVTRKHIKESRRAVLPRAVPIMTMQATPVDNEKVPVV